MPFDGKNTVPQPPPTPADLAALLRDRSRWPKGFVWNYVSGRTCAIGLANRHWHGMAGSQVLAKFNPYDRARIFIHLDSELEHDPRPWFWQRRRPYQGVTPEQVADAIDAYIAGLTM